jgi:hypothetical protein
MTEAEWLGLTDPATLLLYMRGQSSDRKLRLFACACCRRVWHLLKDVRSQQAIEATEQFADGRISAQELADAEAGAWDAVNDLLDRMLRTDRAARPRIRAAVEAAKAASEAARCRPRPGGDCGSPDIVAPAGPIWVAAWLAAGIARDATRRSMGGVDRDSIEAAEKEAQAALLREIVGNPFRTPTLPKDRPPLVASLARAFYGGKDCRLALAEALKDGGWTELAEHFQQPSHPRGCWALDHILGQ